jgi:glutaconate CoA-transferase subunit B
MAVTAGAQVDGDALDAAGVLPFSRSELMAIELAAHLRDDDVAVMGTASALPQVACRVAQLTHAPGLWSIAGGTCSVNPHLSPVVSSCCDFDLLRADTTVPLSDVVLLEGRGDVLTVFFAGGLQIDAYGNCNLVSVGDWASPTLRGPGTVGLPFLSRVGRVLIYTQSHNRRTFVEKVDFLSGPGFLGGPDQWASAGLSGGGPALVVTPLCTMDFDPDSLRMRLVSVHPGVEIDEVRKATGFDLLIPDSVPVTAAPTSAQLSILRGVDTDGLLKGP